MSETKEYFQLAKERLIKQLEDVDRYNSKVNTLLITCGVFIAFLGELASRKGIILGIGLPFIVIAVCVLLWAYRIADWQDTPNPDYLLSELEESADIENFYKLALRDVVECYKENNIFIDMKVNRINISSKFLIIGIFVSIIGLFIYLFLLGP